MWEPDELTLGCKQDWRQARVLVAVVPSVRDWERICREGWYRIPLARAPRRIGAEYVAFYHTATAGDLRWSIRYLAPVRGYRLVPRRELIPEEPAHARADELYYRLELGPLKPLPRPIPSRALRRITFILTTLERLFQAQEINDLWLKANHQQALGRAWRLGEAAPAYATI